MGSYMKINYEGGFFMNENIKKLEPINIETVDINSLADIKDVVVDKNLTKQERIDSFVKQIKNPYCFKCGKIVVGVKFADDGETMEEKVKQIIMS